MMTLLGKGPVDPEIKHEGRAGKFLPGDLLVCPTTTQLVRHKSLNSVSKVGVEDHSIGRMYSALCPHARSAAPLENNFFNRRIQMDLDPKLLRYSRHGAAA